MAETHHEHPDSSESRPTVEKFYIADVFTPAQRDRSLMQWPFILNSSVNPRQVRDLGEPQA